MTQPDAPQSEPLPAAPAPPAPAERIQCLGAHLLALIGPVAWLFGIVIPGINVVGPLVLHGVLDPASPLVRSHTAASVNFQLLAALIGIPLTLLTFTTAGRVVVWIMALIWLAFVARGLHLAFKGQPWRPPLRLPLIRES